MDSEGAAYVTANTHSIDFPTKNPIQGSYGGIEDGFITKINSSGTALVYSTYLGGSDSDGTNGIAVNSEGAACVTGWTFSSDFPTQNPIQGSYGGGEYDAFIAKINSSGTALVYSTYLGGSDNDEGKGIAVDSEGAAYVSGYTDSIDFPTQNPIQGTNAGQRDTFIAKLYFTPSSIILIITAGSGGTTDPSLGPYPYDEATEVSIRAIPNTDYGFSHWSGDVPQGHENDNPITITVDSIKSIKANFIQLRCTLTISAGTGGTTEPNPGTHKYDTGTEVSVTATPDSGHEFSGWSDDASGTTNPITITMDSYKSITANFIVIPPTEQAGKKGGCFIATAAYGSPLHPYLETLRDFRDKFLMPSKLGSKLVELYYKYSPFVADLIKKHKVLKIVVQINLMPMVVFGYSMVHFGPIFTIVMLVLIFALPILFIASYRKKLRRVEAKDPKVLASLD